MKPRKMGRDPIGDLECLGLEQLQCEFLRQHDIPLRKVTLRHEAQNVAEFAVPVELFDVHLVATPDALALAGVAACH